LTNPTDRIQSVQPGTSSTVTARIAFKVLATLSFLMFIVIGPALVLAFHLSLPIEILLVVLVPGLIGGAAAYLVRPDKFRSRRR
jgi:hypothetical protein